METENMFQI